MTMTTKIQQLFIFGIVYAVAAISTRSSIVSAQDAQGDGTEEEVWYQWQTEAFVTQCPTDDLPPFRLDDPTVSQRPNGVILSYSTQIPDTRWVEYMVSDEECANVIPTGPPGGDELVPLFSTLDVSYSDYVTSSATARLRLDVNPAGLQEYGGLFYTETQRTGAAPEIVSEGNARVCVRMAIWNGIPGSPDAAEITWLDTIVLFGVEMTVEDESFLDFSQVENRSDGTGRSLRVISQTHESAGSQATAAAKESTDSNNVKRYNRRLCESTWGLDVFTCPPGVSSNSSAVTSLPDEPNNETIPNDLPVRLCIQPNAITRTAGVTLKDVQGLYYSSPSVTDAGVQTAVEEFSMSLDGKTIKTCGEEICVIETTMNEAFHGKEVLASGKTIFQPSVETVYNQIVVDFQLPIQISDQAIGSDQPSSSPSVKLTFVSALFAGLLAGMVAVVV